MNTLRDLPNGTQIYLHRCWWVITFDTVHHETGKPIDFRTTENVIVYDPVHNAYAWAKGDMLLTDDQVGEYHVPFPTIHEVLIP